MLAFIGYADVYVWFMHNKWWVAAIVPFILAILVVKALSPK